MDKKGYLTRMDCTFHDRASSVSLNTIKAAVTARQCVTRANCWHDTQSGLIHEGTSTGEIINIGSRQSTTCLRIYDKRLQLQTNEHADWSSTASGGSWSSSNSVPSSAEVSSSMRDAEDEHRCRAPLLDWWEMLTEGFRKSGLVDDGIVNPQRHPIGTKTQARAFLKPVGAARLQLPDVMTEAVDDVDNLNSYETLKLDDYDKTF